MNSFDFKKNKFVPVFALDQLIPPRIRHALHQSAKIFFGIGVVLFLYHRFSSLARIPGVASAPPLPLPDQMLAGILLMAGGVWLNMAGIQRFVQSKTRRIAGDTASSNIARRLNLFAAELQYAAGNPEARNAAVLLLGAALKTEAGRMTLLRLGIPFLEYASFLANSSLSPTRAEAPLTFVSDADRDITLGDVLKILFDADQLFRVFLQSRQITRESLGETASWVERTLEREYEIREWWSWENLARIPGMGKTWAYGPVFTIAQYGNDLRAEALNMPHRLIGREREITLLESTLLKQAGANVVIVGDPGTGKETLLLGLARMILEGRVFPELESKRIFRLSGPSIVATGKTKGETEALLIKIFNEAVQAGDIILAIEDFPEFVASLGELGIIGSQILDPYLVSPDIHIIALANISSFRRVLEPDTALMKFFEKIVLQEPDEHRLLDILKDIAPLMEAKSRKPLIVTLPGLEKIREAAMRYIVTGALPERAVNLLEEIVSDAAARGLTLITPDHVSDYVSRKTKMPLGDITAKEQTRLINLEEQLHERVVDQVEAINAIANAVRRARVGIQESKRPIGTFLFLGPTGVGKTETAKALAAVYFGNEESMIRLDMTEFQTEEGLERLLGSFEKNRHGVLASRVRQNPYCVLLLDEFEKADRKVIDLFLQVLDEGFFTDAFGSRVTMRNTIIIATSNAGASLIWEWIKQGIDPTAKKDEIIAAIQRDGKFRPELLNRFDAIIIYRPLTPEHLKKIARLMLAQLIRRLATQQDVRMNVTDELIEEMVKQGYDPSFGARPMRRFIQEKVEKAIADKIIRKELTRGQSVTLDVRDIA